MTTQAIVDATVLGVDDGQPASEPLDLGRAGASYDYSVLDKCWPQLRMFETLWKGVELLIVESEMFACFVPSNLAEPNL